MKGCSESNFSSNLLFAELYEIKYVMSTSFISANNSDDAPRLGCLLDHPNTCLPFPLHQVCDRPRRNPVGVAFDVIAIISAPTIIIAIILAAVVAIAIVLAAFRVIAVSFSIHVDTVCVAVIAKFAAFYIRTRRYYPLRYYYPPRYQLCRVRRTSVPLSK